MCTDHKSSCSCGKSSPSLHFKDDLLPPGVVSNLYCPACSSGTKFNPATMISDNGWIIEYDMEIARFGLGNVPGVRAITPELLFDEGYCTWRGVYPNDHIDSARERDQIIQLAKTDPKRYFEELKNWSAGRMERLAREGWRKAREADHVNR